MLFEAILILVLIIIFDLTYRFFTTKPKKSEKAKRNKNIEVEEPAPKAEQVYTRRFTRGRFTKGRFTRNVEDIIGKELFHFNESIHISLRSNIPDTQYIPIKNPLRWFKIHSVICCFVDMKGSTKLTASPVKDEDIAKAYRLFTETAIRIFHEFGSPYIDVKGDGVFALFNPDQSHRALAATISFKTFVYEYFWF